MSPGTWPLMLSASQWVSMRQASLPLPALVVSFCQNKPHPRRRACLCSEPLWLTTGLRVTGARALQLALESNVAGRGCVLT